jgi:hypothetical protein
MRSAVVQIDAAVLFTIVAEMQKIKRDLGILPASTTLSQFNDMASSLSIAYFANHDLLGLVSEEEYEQFKSQLLQALQEEWPDATVTIDDDEDVYFETQGISGQAELDVRARVADIVKEVIDSGDWQEEEEDFYEDEEELGDIDTENKDDY